MGQRDNPLTASPPPPPRDEPAIPPAHPLPPHPQQEHVTPSPAWAVSMVDGTVGVVGHLKEDLGLWVWPSGDSVSVQVAETQSLGLGCLSQARIIQGTFLGGREGGRIGRRWVCPETLTSSTGSLHFNLCSHISPIPICKPPSHAAFEPVCTGSGKTVRHPRVFQAGG